MSLCLALSKALSCHLYQQRRAEYSKPSSSRRKWASDLPSYSSGRSTRSSPYTSHQTFWSLWFLFLRLGRSLCPGTNWLLQISPHRICRGRNGIVRTFRGWGLTWKLSLVGLNDSSYLSRWRWWLLGHRSVFIRGSFHNSQRTCCGHKCAEKLPHSNLGRTLPRNRDIQSLRLQLWPPGPSFDWRI